MSFVNYNYKKKTDIDILTFFKHWFSSGLLNETYIIFKCFSKLFVPNYSFCKNRPNFGIGLFIITTSAICYIFSESVHNIT